MPSTPPRTWLITGCDKGLGRATAEAALRNGDRVAATVLARDGRSSLTDEFAGACKSHTLDVTDPASIRAAVDWAQGEFGGIDILLNNAGYGLVGAAEETTADEYRPMFDVNFFGAAEVTRCLLPSMRKRRSGHIICISSLVGFVGFSGFSFYSASKFALEGFCKSLARETATLGIRVTIVEPGGARTDFSGGSLARAKNVIDDYATSAGATRQYMAARHGGQPGDPHRIGAAIVAIAGHANPPLRLPLGADALQQVQEKVASASSEFESWKSLTLSTAFTD